MTALWLIWIGRVWAPLHVWEVMAMVLVRDRDAVVELVVRWRVHQL